MTLRASNTNRDIGITYTHELCALCSGIYELANYNMNVIIKMSL